MKHSKKKSINPIFLIILLFFSCATSKHVNKESKSALSFDTVEMNNNDENKLRIEEFDLNKSIQNNPTEKLEHKQIAVLFGPGLYRSFRGVNFLKSLQESKSIQVGMFCGIEFGAIIAFMASEGWRPEKMEWFFFGLSKIIKNIPAYSTEWKRVMRNYLDKNLISNKSNNNFCFTYNDGENNHEVVHFGKDQLEIFYNSLGIGEDSKLTASKKIDETITKSLYAKDFSDVIFVDTINASIDFKSNIDRSFYSGFYGRYKSDGLRLKKSLKLYVDISDGPSPIDEFPDFLGDLNRSLFLKSKKYLSDFSLNNLNSGDDDESNF